MHVQDFATVTGHPFALEDRGIRMDVVTLMCSEAIPLEWTTVITPWLLLALAQARELQ